MAGAWQLDKGNSAIKFSVRHLMISTVRGRFNVFDIKLIGDPRDLLNASLDVTIHAASINTNEKERDAHLCSDEFFAVEKFPYITFKSRRIQSVGNDTYHVEGEMTVRDRTKLVVLTVSLDGEGKDPSGRERAAFSGELTLSRKELGLTWNLALEAGGVMVSDEVNVVVEAQFVNQA